MQLNSFQETLAAKIAGDIRVNDENMAEFPGPGYGKTLTMLSAVTRVGADKGTYLIATHDAMCSKWVKEINRFRPYAAAYTLDRAGFFTLSSDKARLQIEAGKLHRVWIEPAKFIHAGPVFFVAPFSGMKSLVVEGLQCFFDIVIEDESYPAAHIEKMRDVLKCLGKKYVRIAMG